MGTLLCPLTLLWEPLCELIATHARGMERDAFWEPFQHWTAIAAAKSGTSVFFLFCSECVCVYECVCVCVSVCECVCVCVCV